MAEVSWMIKGIEYANCNCAYGCPCQFNALPSYGDCKYVLFARIDEGRYGETNLDGLVYSLVGAFPGAVHEGNGTQQLILDEGMSEEQREALQKDPGKPITIEDDQAQAFYVLIDAELHQRAMTALQQQQDWESIQQGIAQADAGDTMPLEEADRKIREEFGFLADS